MKNRYGLPDISTGPIVYALDARVGDYLHDPEPQYDAFFECVPREKLEALEEALRDVLKEYAHVAVERVVEQTLDGYELARSED